MCSLTIEGVLSEEGGKVGTQRLVLSSLLSPHILRLQISRQQVSLSLCVSLSLTRSLSLSLSLSLPLTRSLSLALSSRSLSFSLSLARSLSLALSLSLSRTLYAYRPSLPGMFRTFGGAAAARGA